MRYYSSEAVSDERNYYEIWRIYEMAAKTCGVIRAGSGLYGAPYDYREAKSDANTGRRGESVAEHQYLATVLLLEFYRRFPKYHPSDPYGKLDLHEFLSEITLLLYHDVSEVVTGDIPADGSRDMDEKKVVEGRIIREFACHMPADSGEMLIHLFEGFDEADGASCIPRIADKVEALTRAALYEAAGYVGKIGYKASNYNGASVSDLCAAEATRSERQLDIWSHQFIRQYSHKKSFREFFGIALVGVLSARGEVFSWLDSGLRAMYDEEKMLRMIEGSAEE